MSSLGVLQLTSSSSLCLQSTRRTRWVWPWDPGHDEYIWWLKGLRPSLSAAMTSVVREHTRQQWAHWMTAVLVRHWRHSASLLLLSSAQLMRIWSHSTVGSNKGGPVIIMLVHIMRNGSYGDYTHQLFDAGFMNWTEQEVLFCSSKRSFLLAALSMDVGTEFMLTPKFSWWLFLCFINQLWSMLYFKCPPHCWGWQKFCDLMYLQAGTNTTNICFNNSNCDSWLVPPGEGSTSHEYPRLWTSEPFEDAPFIPNHDTITLLKNPHYLMLLWAACRSHAPSCLQSWIRYWDT